jgi:starch-binding outer membrane protein, SusD/RagB family
MKNNIQGYVCAVVGLFLMIGTYSCKKDFENKPVNSVVAENSYQNLQDANTAVLGIYGKLITLANQYEILNELRGDLLDVTVNADKDLNDINQHNVQTGNAYANPSAFYTVINNCNDALEHFKLMKKNGVLNESDYSERYSDIISIRCWLYFQLAIHYGSVPYITKSVESPEEVIYAGTVAKLPFTQLIDTLTYTMVHTTRNVVAYLNFAGTFDVADLNYLWIHKNFLLGELYMWKGDYLKAAAVYRDIMSEKYPWSTALTGQIYHKLSNLWDGPPQPYYWISQFAVANTNEKLRDGELIWTIDIDNQYAPHNLLDQLFTSNGGGTYVLKPSQVSIDNWYTAPGSGVTFDPRGENASWRMNNGHPEVFKQLQMSVQGNVSAFAQQLPTRWYIWRQTGLWLHYEECANRCGRTRFALDLLNGGPRLYVYGFVNDKSTTNLPYPFNFDSRHTTDVILTPGIPAGVIGGSGVSVLAEFGRTGGIRGRVWAVSYNDTITGNGASPILNGYYKKIQPTTTADSMVQVENIIIDEGALEQAYEGQRWPDLLRIAMRRNDPAYLADRVSEKFRRANSPIADKIRTRLMDPKNWFLPFPSTAK